MQLYCRICASEIPAENINLDNLVAKCAVCNAVFSIAEKIEQPRRQTEPLNNLVLPIPYGLTAERTNDQLMIRWSWFRLEGLLLLGITVLLWAIPSFFRHASLTDAIAISLLFCPLLIPMTYYVAAELFNSTHVLVTADRLIIRNRPIPTLPVQRTIPRADIRQLYCMAQSLGKGRTDYTIHVITKDWSQEQIMRHLETPQQALFVEHIIEAFLDIPHQHVPGAIE